MPANFNTNLINVATAYIQRIGIAVSNTSLRENLIENPYFPSLYSLCNVFERFHIETTAFKPDKETFEKLRPPFIAYLKNQPTGKDFVLVTSTTKNEVHYIAGNKKVKKVPKEDFFKNWEDIVLQAQPDKHSGEKDFRLNRKKEINKRNKTTALILSASLIFLATVYFFLHSLPEQFIISATALLVIKMFGMATTVLLLMYEIDKCNAFVKSICTAGKQTNCNAVLQSSASKIFGLSWSEAGFFYFASTFLFLLLPGINFIAKVCLLSIANCLAAPYILFSLYYQWKVVKQWCPLCLSVQAVLAMELIWSVINLEAQPFARPANALGQAFSFPLSTFLLIIYCILIPVTAWFIIKPLILKAKNEPVYKAAYKRLLYNPETFNHLLQQQTTAPNGYQNMGIEIGNPAAENTIIKVCNPYCGPCAKAHPVLDEIVHQNKNVKLKLIFTASNDKDDKRGIAARHLLAINEKQDVFKTKQALDDWYLADKKDYEAFAAKYPMNGELKQQEKQIEEMKEWCKEAEISFTPTIFINGHKLPDNYKIEELKYIL